MPEISTYKLHVHEVQSRPIVKLLLRTLLLCTALASTQLHAVDYDVEIIIFEHIRDTGVGASNTLLVPVVPNPQRIPETAVPGNPIQPLGELRLSAEAEKIKGSNNHRLLYHGGWRQGAIDKENAPYMSIALGRSFNALVDTTPPQKSNVRKYSAQNSDAETDEDPNIYLRGYLTPPLNPNVNLQQRRSNRLIGSIKVWVGRFLHFDTHLSYTPTGAGYSFAFESTRRMRSRQMHYIDHPRVGIITKICPVDNTAPN